MDLDTDMDTATAAAAGTPTWPQRGLIGHDCSGEGKVRELDSNKFLMFTLYGDSGNFLIKVNWKVLLCHCTHTHTKRENEREREKRES